MLLMERMLRLQHVLHRASVQLQSQHTDHKHTFHSPNSCTHTSNSGRLLWLN